MADTIVIHFHDSQITEVSWHPLGKNPSPLSPRGSGTLEQAAAQLKGWRLLVVAPSQEILLTQVAIPSRNKQRMAQAIPYALENDLTQEIEQLHFAFDPLSEEDHTAVAVIARSRLESWLKQMDAWALHPLGVYPELLCLPLHEGHWSLYLDESYGLIRTGKHAGLVSEAENLAAFLRMSLRDAGTPPERIDLYHRPADQRPELSQLANGLGVELVGIEHEGNTTAFLAENLDQRQSLNLLQGDYQQVDRKAVQWRRWLPAAALFLLLIGINVVSTLLDYSHYKQQSLALHNEIHRVFRETFPDKKRIVDPKIQMEQQLRLLKSQQKGAQVGFLELFSHPAATLSKTLGSKLESISYRDNQLDLKLTLKDLQSLEVIKQAIESEPALSVEIKSANAAGNQITSHLRIKRGDI